MPNFTQSVEKALRGAIEDADRLGHREAALLHLLKHLLDDEDALQTLRAMMEKFAPSDLRAFVTKQVESLPKDEAAVSGKAMPSSALKTVVQRAALAVTRAT